MKSLHPPMVLSAFGLMDMPARKKNSGMWKVYSSRLYMGVSRLPVVCPRITRMIVIAFAISISSILAFLPFALTGIPPIAIHCYRLSSSGDAFSISIVQNTENINQTKGIPGTEGELDHIRSFDADIVVDFC